MSSLSLFLLKIYLILTYLFFIRDRNDLTGNIPQGIFTLKSLVLLDLDNNRLTGVISRRVAELANLQFLTIGNNSFDRQEVPLAISTLERLSKITFSFQTTTLV